MRDDITLKVKNAGEITAEYQVIGDPRNAVERRARVYVERLDFHAHGRQHQGRSRTGTVVQAAGSCPWEADTPAGVWAGSDQRSRHAVGMPALQSGYSLSRSANCYSVRDRGVGGSNPLAPTNFKEIRGIQSAGSLGSRLQIHSRNRVVGASNPAFIQNRSRFLASVAHDWSIPETLRSKALPSTLPDIAVGH